MRLSSSLSIHFLRSHLFLLAIALSICVFSANSYAQQSPELTIHSPSANSSFNSQELISFSASAYDLGDGDISHKIVWRSNINKRLGRGANISTKLSVGEHIITAKVKNSTKNRAQIKFALTVSAAAPVNQPPQISILSPVSGDVIDHQTSTSFNASAFDHEDGDLSYNIDWQSNHDGHLGRGDYIAATLSSGNHIITASITDSAGTSQTQQITLSVNMPENTAPTLVISSPSAEQNFESDSLISFTATASDHEDGSLDQHIQWSSDIDGHLGSGNYVSAQLSVGLHTISASVADSENLSSQHQVNIVVEQPVIEPPIAETEATVSWLAPTHNTDGSALTDLASFKIYYGTSATNLVEYVTIADASMDSFTFTQLDANTTYYFAVTAINRSGTESSRSEMVSKTF